MSQSPESSRNNAGHNANHNAGYRSGYNAGYNAGYKSGYNAGYSAGQNAGQNAGPNAGAGTAPERLFREILPAIKDAETAYLKARDRLQEISLGEQNGAAIDKVKEEESKALEKRKQQRTRLIDSMFWIAESIPGIDLRDDVLFDHLKTIGEILSEEKDCIYSDIRLGSKLRINLMNMTAILNLAVVKELNVDADKGLVGGSSVDGRHGYTAWLKDGDEVVFTSELVESGGSFALLKLAEMFREEIKNQAQGETETQRLRKEQKQKWEQEKAQKQAQEQAQ